MCDIVGLVQFKLQMDRGFSWQDAFAGLMPPRSVVRSVEALA